jgi:hypothetical protein
MPCHAPLHGLAGPSAAMLRHGNVAARMMHRTLLLAAILAAGPALQAAAQPRDAAEVLRPSAGADWHGLATAQDRQRLGALPGSWAEALENARAGGQAGAVAAAGPLLDSRPAATDAQPPDGIYRCRSFRIGAAAADSPAFIAYAPFRCRIRMAGGATIFEKLTGSQRTAGTILPGGPGRFVLLGTEALGAETGFPAYGADAARDRIATVERVDADRWRLVFPRPSNGAVLEVMELVRAR